MSWFDILMVVIALGVLIRSMTQEAGRGLMEAIATLVAAHFSALIAVALTSALGWRPAPGMDASPPLYALSFALLLAAGLALSKLLHGQTRWSMDNFDFLFGIVFGLVVVVSAGHAVTQITAGWVARPDGTLPEFLQNSCLADELRSFRSYHYVLNVFHGYQAGRN